MCREKERNRKREQRAKRKAEQLLDHVDGHKRTKKPKVMSKQQSAELPEAAKLKSVKKKGKRLQQNIRRLKASAVSPDKRVDQDIVSPDNVRKMASRAKQHLPSCSTRWGAAVGHLIKQATPRRRSIALKDLQADCSSTVSALARKVGRPTRKEAVAKQLIFTTSTNKHTWQYLNRNKKDKVGKLKKKREHWARVVKNYLERDDVSRQMPGKRDVIKDDQGILVAKRHLLMTKRQAYKKFKVENTGYPYQFTTFRKTIPRHIKQLSLKHRRVCICTRCYNTENKLKALSKKAIQAGELDLQMTLNGAYVEFICPYVEEFPNRDCIIGSCKHCGPAKLKERYSPLTNKLGVDEVSWLEWKLIKNEYTDTKGNFNKKKCWRQETVKDELKNVVEKLCDEMKDIAGHLYRANFQHAQEQYLIKNLPLDEALIHCDFSQNYALTPQDEIESAHFQQKQVTLHTCLLIRHAVTSTNDNPILVKESIGQFSDNLKHDKDACFSFTDQLIKHIQNSDGYEINKIHRFSDNAATQYKCKESFSHLQSFQEKYKIKLVYHYCEPGHGKGPADGIGATIKNGLARAVESDAVVLNKAYRPNAHLLDILCN